MDCLRPILTTLILFGLVHFATADVITHFNDGNGSDVPKLLESVGIESGSSYTETIYEAFIIPDNTQSLTFEFIRDTGSYLFTFGMFDIHAPTVNPQTNPMAYALQAITNSIVIFDNRTSKPGSTFLIEQPSTATVGFYIIPNDDIKTFLTRPQSFYQGNRPTPLFTNAAANPGGLDQAMSFTDTLTGKTLFTFEDLTRTGLSDEDFTDMSFTVTPALMPTPSPWQQEREIVDIGFRPVSIPGPTAWLAGVLLCLPILFKSRHETRMLQDVVTPRN